MATGLLTPTHIAIVLIVLLLIFGPKRLPQTGRALGAGLREFRDALAGHHAQAVDLPPNDTPTPTPTQGETS